MSNGAMNENSWFEWVLGVIVLIIGWLGNRLHDKVDKHSDRLDIIEKEKVSRDELAATLQTMREDRLRMHQENREDLDYIRRRVDDLNDSNT